MLICFILGAWFSFTDFCFSRRACSKNNKEAFYFVSFLHIYLQVRLSGLQLAILLMSKLLFSYFSTVYKLISKRLSVENKAKFSQLELKINNTAEKVFWVSSWENFALFYADHRFEISVSFSLLLQNLPLLMTKGHTFPKLDSFACLSKFEVHEYNIDFLRLVLYR